MEEAMKDPFGHTVKHIEVNPMFYRVDTPTIMSGLVVRYKMASSDLYDGEINASRDGVGIAGRFPIMDVESVVLFEETVARARIQAGHLRQDRPFGPRIQALTEEEVDKLLSIPLYEVVGA